MTATSQRLVVSFPALNPAEANRAAIDLQETILAACPGHDTLDVQVHKDRERTMDAGSTLVVLLGTPALTAVIGAIRSWILKYGNSVEIKTTDGTVLARGDAAAKIDIAATVAALRGTRA